MNEYTLHYTLTYPEFYEGLRAVAVRTSPIAWVGAGFLGVCVIFVFFCAIVNPFHANVEHASNIYWLLIAIVLLIPAMWPYATRYRRMWKLNPQLSEPHALILSDDSISEQFHTTKVQTGWYNIKKWKETANVVTIVSNIGVFIVPKKQISEADLKYLIALLQTKVVQSTGGFPVQSHDKSISSH